MNRLLFLFAVTLLPASAHALTVKVQLDQGARTLLGAQLPVAESMIEAEIARQAQALLGSVNATDFLQQSATAQSLVNKGLGADYASTPSGFMLGVGVGIAAQAGDSTLSIIEQAGSGEFDTAVPVGAGAQVSLLAGYNFSRHGIRQLTAYIHGMGAPISFSKFRGSFYNFGASVQYKPFDSYGPKLFRWGGIAITSGFEVSKMKLVLTGEDTLAFSTNLGGVQIQSTSSEGLSLVQNAVSIPLELTSNVTMLHFLTLYGGVGLDVTFGQAGLHLEADTTINANTPAGAQTGQASASIDDAKEPDRISPRVLGGVQINMGPFKVFSQVNFLPKDTMVSMTAGAKWIF